jgi:hypothetical protein
VFCISEAIGTAMSSPGQSGQETCTIFLIQFFDLTLIIVKTLHLRLCLPAGKAINNKIEAAKVAVTKYFLGL